MKDPYEVLGIPRTATDDEVKTAYRNMARKYHPDNYTDNPLSDLAQEKMQEINEAYEVLSDDQKRSRYDQFGFAGVDPNYGGGAGGYGGSGFGGFGDFGDLGDIFGDVFGNFFGGGTTRRRSSAIPGDDVDASLTLTFEESVFGCKKSVTITRKEWYDLYCATGKSLP